MTKIHWHDQGMSIFLWMLKTATERLPISISIFFLAMTEVTSRYHRCIESPTSKTLVCLAALTHWTLELIRLSEC
ncbi:hypothetical protein BDV30DRAFT_69059 [Aspergillus minisclerotigenes]|uniref:Uncharacterized protein n=1 Tax=Aspergillus minisclerotigenes TaxID=656917 RepID=A0A5N6JAS0_9EURO|nr:hypothetical protein BDV30DRAFT_69059 [Aspergillus minisclerotigenes]